MILTVTPSPTVDRTLFVRHFRLGAVVRAEREVVTPSGKGVDASLVVHELGGATLAMGLNAGHTGDLLLHLLDQWGVPHDFVPAQGETRTAVVLVDLAVQQQSTITAPTLRATAAHLNLLLARLEQYAGQAWGAIFAGSLPPGLPIDSYAHLVRHARGLGMTTLLDASGERLRAGVAGRPHILKINREELQALDPDLMPRQGAQPGTAEMSRWAGRLATRLGQWASDALIITLGAQGALAVTTDGIFFAQPPPVQVVNTAGAGDALDGGILLAFSQGADWPAALRLGTAAAASVVMNEGTALCRRVQVQALHPQVQITPLNLP